MQYVVGMKIGLRYQTIYRYEQPVGFSPHELRLFPRNDRFTRTSRMQLETQPDSRTRFARDVFDNTVASCLFPEKSDELRLQLALDLELEPKDPFDFLLESDAVETPFEYDDSIRAMLEPYRRLASNELLTVPAWTPPTHDRPRPTVEALVELNRALHECVGYERREEGVARRPIETLRLMRGACRDVALLFADVARQIGFAARLVSGYLREADMEKKRAEGSLHAWTEVFLPGAGWIGFDATNGVLCNHNFIAAAVGITPADITPISGNYFHHRQVPSHMTSRLEFVQL